MIDAKIVYHDYTGEWFIEFSGSDNFTTKLYSSITDAIKANKKVLIDDGTYGIVQVVLHSASPDVLPNYVNVITNKKFGDRYGVYKGDIKSIF